MTVVVTDSSDGATATAASTANVQEGSFVLNGTAPLTATEGQAFTSTVATFSDPGSPDPASAFTATVDWGDGVTETSAANPNDITVTGSAGNYTVTGTHTYADEFSGDINVTVSEGAFFTIGPNPDSITVAEGDTLTPINNSNVSFPENAAEFGFVARFSDTYTGNVASDFTATIDWGDGTRTTGVIPTGGAGSFTVSGGHTYADEGVFTITTVLTDDAPGTASATSSFMVTVTEADTLAAASVQPNVTLTESATTSGAIAVFSDAGYPNNSASDFSATIDWGDGATTAGTVSSAGDGNFTVSGSHAYADEGSFTATVVLTDDAPGTDSATASSTVTVLDADTLSATATPVIATEGTPLTNAVVATFSDTDASNTAGDFTATILWGDGTSSTGSVSGAAGAFTVTGDHTYFDEGVFTPTVFVADDAPGTASASGVGTATVADNDTLSGSLAAVSTTEGTSFSGTVATFTDTTYPSNPATDFTATIDWGDGTTASGTILGAGGGTFSVSGSHTYADEGSFTVSVVLTDDAPGTASATATGTATVAEGDFGPQLPDNHADRGEDLQRRGGIVHRPGQPVPGGDRLHGDDRLGRRHDHPRDRHRRDGRPVHHRRQPHLRRRGRPSPSSPPSPTTRPAPSPTSPSPAAPSSRRATC